MNVRGDLSVISDYASAESLTGSDEIHGESGATRRGSSMAPFDTGQQENIVGPALHPRVFIATTLFALIK